MLGGLADVRCFPRVTALAILIGDSFLWPGAVHRCAHSLTWVSCLAIISSHAR